MAIDQQDNNNGVLNNGTTNGAGLTFGTGSGEGIASDRNSGVNLDGLDFYTDSIHRMSILHNGNVGINNTNPLYQLDVAGTVNATLFTGNGGGLTNINVRVTNVVTNFENGATLLNLNAYGNLFLPLPVTIYANSGNFIYGDDNGNSYFGPSAGTENVGNPGGYNTGVGGQALVENSTGTGNTADGYGALDSNSTGNNNTSVGGLALSDSNGTNNIALGYLAGSVLSSGNNNIYIGNIGKSSENGTIRIGTPGTQTTTIIAGVITGNGGGLTNISVANLNVVTNLEAGIALSNLTVNGGLYLSSLPLAIYSGPVYAPSPFLYADQNENSYLGLEAGQANPGKSGGDNTGFGNEALYEDTTGANNTAVGGAALELVSSGGNNTAVGALALNGGNGNNDIAIGSVAGDNYNGSESGNIAIGNLGVSGDNNTIRIGTSQTQTYIAGVIHGNASGLTGLTLAQLPFGVLTNDEAGVTELNGLNLTGPLYLSDTLNLASPEITSGGNTLLYSDNSGDFFAGDDAGYNNSSGIVNTAIGYEALEANTSGSANTALGFDALVSNTSGSNNVANGSSALDFNTSGSYNTADGYQALFSNTKGNNNTANGYQALNSNLKGGNNLASGYQALFFNTSGSLNTGDGNQALAYNATGTDNTAVGDRALLNVTNGNFNIAVGNSAGVNFTASESHNIDIGNQGVQGENNIIRIGTTGVQTATYLVGTVSVPVLTITGGSDLAEPFQISAREKDVPEGAVVVIDDQIPGHLKLSDGPYDQRVAGVVSGANGIHPGIQMHQQGLLEGGQNVALSGRVYVQADASNGAIRPGDMLTTSSLPGYAMKVTDHAKAEGAILGKAMTSLNEGSGMVLVLVTLQ